MITVVYISDATQRSEVMALANNMQQPSVIVKEAGI